MIGIDPHKKKHTAVAITQDFTIRERFKFDNTKEEAAAATAIGNLITQPDDITKGVEFAEGTNGLKGVIIIKDDKVGLWGDINICQTSM